MTDTRPQVRYWIPEAYVSDEGLRADVRSLARRGFGAIELVAVNFFDQPMPDECRWGTDAYYHAVRTVIEEATRLGLAVDVANGPGWPISVPQIRDADDPATLYELTYGEYEVVAGAPAPLPLPERRVTHDEGTPRLVAACAYQKNADGTLDEGSYVDLASRVHGSIVDWAPRGDGTWELFAFWGQPACHKVLGRFYVVDHLSREGAKASAAWWMHELFPALGEQGRHLRSFFCDSLEYRVAMEWTRDFPQVFEERYGYSILPYLPVVGEPATYPKNDVAGYSFADDELTAAVRHDYLETCSWMYADLHLRTLCEAADALGKMVRYQVAYNKPFCEENASSRVHIPETESLGRPTLDNLRAMAGGAHLSRRPYLSFEAAAEFGHGYGQTQEDMLWWLKRAAIAGCGAQVFHGASYCGDGMEGMDWPGWEAWNRLCSNNWNRTLSERSEREMLDAVARLNALRRGRTLVDLAFYREAYLNDGHGADGAHYVADGGALNAHGYSYEFLSPGLLAHENATVRDGRLDPDGSAYKALVVAHQRSIGTSSLDRLTSLAEEGLPVLVIGADGLAPASMSDLRDRDMWGAALERFLATPNVTLVYDYGELLDALDCAEIAPDASYRSAAVFSAHVHFEGDDVYLLYAGNLTGADPVTGKPDLTTTMPAILSSDEARHTELDVSLRGTGSPYLLDLVTGRRYALEGQHDGERWHLLLSLEADQLVAVGLGDGPCECEWVDTEELSTVTWASHAVTYHELVPSDDRTDFMVAGFREISQPSEGNGFAGYEEHLYEADLTSAPRAARLRLPAYSDALELDVNGEAVPVVSGLGRLVDLDGLLHQGSNHINVRVYTNLSAMLDKGSNPSYGLRGDVELVIA